MATNEQKYMVDHLRDMFNGSFDDEIIESILIQRGWNVDRALDDLMALTSGCTFSIPIEDLNINDQVQNPDFGGFANNSCGAACSDAGSPLVNSQNIYPARHHETAFGSEDGNDEFMQNESEDDVIVLNEEEYCLSAGSDSEEETPAATTTEANSPPSTSQPDSVRPKLSYADAAKPVAPPAQPVSRVKPAHIVYQGYTSYDQIKRTRDSLERVKLYVNEGFKIMVLLRGCPGSGKSYLARKVIEACGIENNIFQHVHCTDNYFCLNKTGQYIFDIEKLPEAHRWNEVNVLHVAREGLTPIVIDNTHTQMWEMEAYVRIAVLAGYEIEVMEPDTPWAFKLKELLKKNQHSVPSHSIVKMLERYEHNVSALSLLKSLPLEYANDKKPPQMGVRKLTNPSLVAVFDNIFYTIHVMAKKNVQVNVPKQKLTKAEKALAKAAKKHRKHERRMKKMVAEVRHEDTESEDEDNESNDSCICASNAETVKAFLSNDLREKGMDLAVQVDEDAASENSWVTIDEIHDDYDDNNSSDDEDESNSEGDSSASSSSSTLSDEARSITPESPSTQIDSVGRAKKSSGSKKKASNAKKNVANTGSTIDGPKNSKLTTSDLKETNKREFSSKLYDALAKNRPRLSCFENLRTGDDESLSESSKDSTFENISRKLDELDSESEKAEGSHQISNELEKSDDLVVDLSMRDSASTPVPCDVDGGEFIETEVVESNALADFVQCTLDSTQNNDTPSNSEVAKLTVGITDAQSDVSRCEWVGLENCVNLPSNVKIEKSVEGLELIPVSVEESTDLSNPIEERNDQSLKVRDVIPSCLINEVVESGADVPLDEQLKETVVPSTIENWTPEWWLCDRPHEPYDNASFSEAVENNSNGLLDSIEKVGNEIVDVEVKEINLTASHCDEISDKAIDMLGDTEEVHLDSPKEPNLATSNELSGDVSTEAATDADATLTEVVEKLNLGSEVENDLESSSIDSTSVSEVTPVSQTKSTSLTSAIRNWLSSNPLSDVKNNAGMLTLNEQPRKTSFSSAIKYWVSGTSRNEVKSNEDVPDGPPASAFENERKLSNSPAAKNLTDDSPSKTKFECKSPIRVVKNKLCNVETEICNEADILQTMLRQEMQNKKRNDTGVNVDDTNVASKFDRDAEGGGAAGTNVVKNIFDGPYEDVNLFGEWNQVEKNQLEHSAVENEADSDNSDAGSNSSSSDEMRTITDVHNSATRFVNNDINRDAVVERKKPDVNHEAGNRQLKNKNMASSAAQADGEGESGWCLDSNTPELNTLKERILISSLDKVFGQNNLELDATAAPVESAPDAKPTNKSGLSGGFQMIENKLRSEVDRKEEAAAISESGGTADEEEVSFWDKWIQGEGWEQKAATEEAPSDNMEPKPPRKIQDSSPPSLTAKSNLKNSDSSSCWLVNDIKNCMDLEKNHQKLPKTSNFLSSGDPFVQAKELREFVDDQKMAAAVKLPKRSPNYDFMDERTDESKNLQRLSSEFSDVFLSAKRKHSDAESVVSSKWDVPSGGESKRFNCTDSALRTSPNSKQQQPQRESPTAPTTEKAVDDHNEEELSRWKFSSLVDYSANLSNYWPKSTSKPSPVPEKEFSLDEAKFERQQKASEFGNFFIPPEVLHLGQNKATNTGASHVHGYDRHLVGRCREINGRGGDANEDDLSPIEARYMSDKSTMTEGNAYTVKAKPQREDLSNMFPHEMADAILDLYEKCNGNMDWIIEILMEDGYSPSDDQLEYLSSLQNVVEFRKSANASPIKEKLSFEKKKCRWRNRNRKNESRQNIAVKNKRFENVQPKLNVSPANVTKDLVCTSEQSVNSANAKENEGENLLGTTMYEDTFDDSTECVDLFIDWTTVSQLIKYFGNPTVYPIEDYQPVIKLPVSLARHLHAHLIESVIDQAEKNEILMNQLNFEMNCGPVIESSSNELSKIDLAEVESSFPDYLLNETLTTRFEEENGVFCCKYEAEPIVRSEDSFAAKFSLNLLKKAFPTMDSSFVKDTFRSQNFNYFKTKSILSQYKDEVPVVNLEEAPPVVSAEVEPDEDNSKDSEIQLFDSSVIKSSSRVEILAQVRKFREDAAANFVQWKRCHEKLKSALRDKRFGVASHCREIMEEFKRKYEWCNAQAASLLVTSCCFQNENIIDLHFFKVVEALRALDIFLDHHITKLASSGRQKAVLYIITGRGSRSADGVSHLQPPIKQRLKQRDIEFCIESTNTGLVKAVIRKSSVLSRDL